MPVSILVRRCFHGQSLSFALGRNPMTRVLKLAVGASALLIAGFMLPIAGWHLPQSGIAGVYYCPGMTCGCGHEVFTFIDSDGYYDFVPGHGPAKKKLCDLRPTESGWAAFRCRDHKHSMDIRLIKGEVFVSSTDNTNSWREERVRNPWRIWIPLAMARVSKSTTATDDLESRTQ